MASSIFTSHITEVIPIGENGTAQSVTVRKLAPRHLEAAAKEQQRKAIADFREMGGAAFVKELESLGGTEKAKAEADKDPLLLYDRATLLHKGIVSWTCEEKLSPEAIDDVDEDIQKAWARRILQLSKPSLFQTAEEKETATKNG